jgi:cytochrome c6
MNNIITFFSVGLLGLMLALYGCGDSSQTATGPATPTMPGLATYKKYCLACHGADGKMGLNGAVDLTASVISKEEAILVITSGRKMMAPYKSILKPAEIDQVADYIITLRQ